MAGRGNSGGNGKGEGLRGKIVGEGRAESVTHFNPRNELANKKEKDARRESVIIGGNMTKIKDKDKES